MSFSTAIKVAIGYAVDRDQSFTGGFAVFPEGPKYRVHHTTLYKMSDFSVSYMDRTDYFGRNGVRFNYRLFERKVASWDWHVEVFRDAPSHDL